MSTLRKTLSVVAVATLLTGFASSADAGRRKVAKKAPTQHCHLSQAQLRDWVRVALRNQRCGGRER